MGDRIRPQYGLAIAFFGGSHAPPRAVGMGAASLVLLIAGWVLCALSARTARRLILGAAIVALTRFFPILQIVAGSVSIGIAESFQLADGGGGNPELDEGGFPEITSELGGFVVTILVGSILLTFASLIGWVLSLVFPKRSLKPDMNAAEPPLTLIQWHEWQFGMDPAPDGKRPRS